MNRAWRQLAGYLGILALVFAQLAVSAYACPLTSIGVADAGSAVAADSPCHEVDPAAANLCDKHCHDAERSQAAGVSIDWAFVAGYVAVLHLPIVRDLAIRRESRASPRELPPRDHPELLFPDLIPPAEASWRRLRARVACVRCQSRCPLHRRFIRRRIE